MIVRLNCDLLSYKKGDRIDLMKIKSTERAYFFKRIKDSRIDNCLNVEEEIKKNIKKNKQGE